MNTQSAGNYLKFAPAIAAIIVSLLLSSCGSSVGGVTFFDENNNGVIDSNEAGVPYAKIIVSRDDNVIAEKYTDETGAFFVQIKAKAGRVCIRPDLSSAQQYFNQSLAESTGKSDVIKALSLGKETETVPATENSSGSNDTSSTNTETQATTKSCGTEGWISGQYCRCVTYKGFEINIPVTKNYSEALREMPKRLETKCVTGSECDIKIIYPTGCQLDTLCLPDAISLYPTTQTGITFDKTLNCVGFTEEQKAQTTETTSASIAVSGFKVVVLKTKTKDDATGEYTISPTATCPGSVTPEQSLPQIPLTIAYDISVALDQKHLGELKSKKQITVIFTITNNGKSPLVKGELSYTIPDGATLASKLVDGCTKSDSGTSAKIKCELDKIASGDFRTRDFKLTLPEVPAGDTKSLESKGQFKASGMSAPADAETVIFKVTG